MSELRWHPLMSQWVVTASQRQDRTFLPPEGFCPLCPTQPGGFPSEIPRPSYDIAVFRNKFPALTLPPAQTGILGSELTPVAPDAGICEVIAYTPIHHTTLAELPLSQIDKLVQVWTQRYQELGQEPEIAYVYIFENKGIEIGVTLHHPHGQIYAYSFIPPNVGLRRVNEGRYLAQHGTNIHTAIIAGEQADGRRIVADHQDWLAFVPFYARWPYEVHIYPKVQREHLGQLTRAEQQGLAAILKDVTQRYDRLWDRSMSYMMGIFQASTDGQPHPETRMNIEFYPPMRTASRRMYRAAGETGAGTFVNATLPEETAQALRDA
ncbi:MAG: galactose-1-phosphate uridylyltransferase [Herpetosiphonaceae bacterium]|nr:galactose-1-phosphate uridylyltransferase [Herpetosiphonaceae bacterium]